MMDEEEFSLLIQELVNLRKLQSYYDQEKCELMTEVMSKITNGQFKLWLEREPNLFKHTSDMMVKTLNNAQTTPTKR